MVIETLVQTPLTNRTSDELATAYKKCIRIQESYKPSSIEFKELEKFKDKMLKQIRSQRTTKSLEELDAETLAKGESNDN